MFVSVFNVCACIVCDLLCGIVWFTCAVLFVFACYICVVKKCLWVFVCALLCDVECACAFVFVIYCVVLHGMFLFWYVVHCVTVYDLFVCVRFVLVCVDVCSL